MGTSTYNEWEASHHRNFEEHNLDMEYDQDIDFSQFPWNSKNEEGDSLDIVVDGARARNVSIEGSVPNKPHCSKVEKWNSFINEVQKMSIEIDDTNEEFI